MKLYATLISTTLLFTTCLSFGSTIPICSAEEIKEIQKKYQETVKAAVDHYCSEPASKDPVLQDQKMCAQLKEISKLEDVAIKGEIINKYNEYKTTNYVSTIKDLPQGTAKAVLDHYCQETVTTAVDHSSSESTCDKPNLPLDASNKEQFRQYIKNMSSKEHQQEIQLLIDISRNACQNECIDTGIYNQYYIDANQAYQEALPKDWMGSIKEFFVRSPDIAEKKKTMLAAWQKYYNANKKSWQCRLISALQFLAMTNYYSKNPASTGVALLSLTQPRGKLTGFRLK